MYTHVVYQTTHTMHTSTGRYSGAQRKFSIYTHMYTKHSPCTLALVETVSPAWYSLRDVAPSFHPTARVPTLRPKPAWFEVKSRLIFVSGEMLFVNVGGTKVLPE
jgi:hypothetical protein